MHLPIIAWLTSRVRDRIHPITIARASKWSAAVALLQLLCLSKKCSRKCLAPYMARTKGICKH